LFFDWSNFNYIQLFTLKWEEFTGFSPRVWLEIINTKGVVRKLGRKEVIEVLDSTDV